jgi:hypothetical protein
MPRGATLVIALEAADVRIGADNNFYISTDQRRRHWILWLDFEDVEDDWGGRHVQYIVAWCPRRPLSREAAALALLGGYLDHVRNCLDREIEYHVVGEGHCSTERFEALQARLEPTGR